MYQFGLSTSESPEYRISRCWRGWCCFWDTEILQFFQAKTQESGGLDERYGRMLERWIKKEGGRGPDYLQERTGYTRRTFSYGMNLSPNRTYYLITKAILQCEREGARLPIIRTILPDSVESWQRWILLSVQIRSLVPSYHCQRKPGDHRNHRFEPSWCLIVFGDNASVLISGGCIPCYWQPEPIRSNWWTTTTTTSSGFIFSLWVGTIFVLCQAVSYLPPFPPRNHTSTQSSLTVALFKFVLVTHWVPEQLYSIQWSPAVPDKYTCPVLSVHQCCLPEFGSVHLLVYWTGSVLSAWWAVEWTGWSTFSAPVPFSQQFIERIGPSHLFGRWSVRVNISGVFFDLSIGIWSLSRSRSFWCFAIEVFRRCYEYIARELRNHDQVLDADRSLI